MRQFAARAARVVLFVDGGGDVGGQTFGSGVVAPHDALQFGEFHHHFAEEVAFREAGGGRRVFGVRSGHGGEFAGKRFEAAGFVGK